MLFPFFCADRVVDIIVVSRINVAMAKCCRSICGSIQKIRRNACIPQAKAVCYIVKGCGLDGKDIKLRQVVLQLAIPHDV